MRKNYQHTIRLTIDDDGVYVQRSRELWSLYLSPHQLLVVVINLAAILLSFRFIYNEIVDDFSAGVEVIIECLSSFVRGPVGGYAPG